MHKISEQGYWLLTVRDANLAKRFAVFLGLKVGILDEKTAFSPIVQYTCVVINLEEEKTVFSQILQYFWGIFIKKTSTKYCKKVTLGISGQSMKL